MVVRHQGAQAGAGRIVAERFAAMSLSRLRDIAEGCEAIVAEDDSDPSSRRYVGDTAAISIDTLDETAGISLVRVLLDEHTRTRQLILHSDIAEVMSAVQQVFVSGDHEETAKTLVNNSKRYGTVLVQLLYVGDTPAAATVSKVVGGDSDKDGAVVILLQQTIPSYERNYLALMQGCQTIKWLK